MKKTLLTVMILMTSLLFMSCPWFSAKTAKIKIVNDTAHTTTTTTLTYDLDIRLQGDFMDDAVASIKRGTSHEFEITWNDFLSENIRLHIVRYVEYTREHDTGTESSLPVNNPNQLVADIAETIGEIHDKEEITVKITYTPSGGTFSYSF